MDLEQTLHKVKTDLSHLDQAVEAHQIELALASAKRVRRNVTVLVRLLAENRDNATAQEGTSYE